MQHTDTVTVISGTLTYMSLIVRNSSKQRSGGEEEKHQRTQTLD